MSLGGLRPHLAVNQSVSHPHVISWQQFITLARYLDPDLVHQHEVALYIQQVHATRYLDPDTFYRVWVRLAGQPTTPPIDPDRVIIAGGADRVLVAGAPSRVIDSGLSVPIRSLSTIGTPRRIVEAGAPRRIVN